jgi:hypothetical protein
MHLFLSLIIIGTGFFYNEETPDSVNAIDAIPSEVVFREVNEPETLGVQAAEPEAVGVEVEVEAVATEAAEPETVEVEAVATEAAEPETVEVEAVATAAAEPETVEVEAVATEAAEPETVEVEAAATEAAEPEVVEVEIPEVDQVTAAWSQLDPSTQAAILMLVEADRMMHVK